jgi:3-phenylpropionate/cinnamic acid dioxygenase small subunit
MNELDRPSDRDQLPLGPFLQWEIEQFLYEEAGLLDERRFEEWASLLAPEIRYVMQARSNRLRSELEHEFAPPTQGAHFDEVAETIAIRVKKLGIDRSWSEDPPSRTRHVVTNVRIRETDKTGEYLVHSNIEFHRSRIDGEYPLLIGRREDLLRRLNGPPGYLIVRREVYLDHTVLPRFGITTFL